MDEPQDYSKPPVAQGNWQQPGGPSPYIRPGEQTYGSSAKLKALYDGYNALNWVFLANVLLALLGRFVVVTSSTPENAATVVLLFALTLFVIVAALTYPQNKKIGFGANWAPSTPLMASILMGLNSALCCGIIGYVVVQNFASKEMKKYGIESAIFGGPKKVVVNARIEQLREAERANSRSPN